MGTLANFQSLSNAHSNFVLKGDNYVNFPKIQTDWFLPISGPLFSEKIQYLDVKQIRMNKTAKAQFGQDQYFADCLDGVFIYNFKHRGNG